MSDLVLWIVEQFKSKTQYQKFIRECDEKFEIKNYRFQQITPAQAKKGYVQLQLKYQQKTFEKSPRSWYENQRKLFIWFLMGLLKLQNWKIKEDRWEELSLMFFQKDVLFLKYQYNTIQKHKQRITWTQRQNQILRDSIQKFQKGQWNQIAKQIFFQTKGEYYKSSKQCRQRWQNHEDPNIIKQEWSNDEDLTILKFVQKQGKKWSKAAQQLKNTRTEHMIKNRFKSLIAKAQAKDSTKYQEQIIVQLITELQNKSELADKVQEQVPQTKLLKKNSVQVWCFDKNSEAKTSQSPANFYFFQSKSPASIMMSTEMPKFILTPSSLSPLDDPYSFATFSNHWNSRLRKKDSLNSTYSCTQNNDQGMLYQARNDGNMQFSREYDQLRTGKKLQNMSPIQRIQARLFNKGIYQKKNEEKKPINDR